MSKITGSDGHCMGVATHTPTCDRPTLYVICRRPLPLLKVVRQLCTRAVSLFRPLLTLQWLPLNCQRSSWVFKMRENRLGARTPLGSFTALPRPPIIVGRGMAAPPENPIPALSHSGLVTRPFEACHFPASGNAYGPLGRSESFEVTYLLVPIESP